MLLIAHRAWSEGGCENTTEALFKSVNKGVRAVEIDVRMKNGEVILSHDKISKEKILSFKIFAEVAKRKNVKLFVELKESDSELFESVVSIIESLGMQDDSFVFAFDNIARHFPWREFKDIKKGVIVEYPWNINRAVKKYNPHFVATGWDNNMPWTRLAFYIYWKLFCLRTFKQKIGVKMMVGVCRDENQIEWLKNQDIDYVTADFEYLQNVQL